MLKCVHLPSDVVTIAWTDADERGLPGTPAHHFFVRNSGRCWAGTMIRLPTPMVGMLFFLMRRRTVLTQHRRKAATSLSVRSSTSCEFAPA